MQLRDPFCLRVYVYQCRNLVAVDEDGTIDPYVKVRFAGNKQRTTTKTSTKNPSFYECLEFHSMVAQDKLLAPNIVVQVWDGKGWESKTPIGAFRVGANIVPSTSIYAGIPAPEWRPLTGIDGKGSMGEVLISFQFIKKRDIDQPLGRPKKIEPALKKVWFDIHVIGLRKLEKIKNAKLKAKDNGTLQIRKPYITFDIASGTYGAKIETAASRIPNPNNPNYLDRLVIMTQLPENPSFVPPLEVQVLDARMFSTLLLGTTAIDLASKLPWNGEDYVPPRQHKIQQDNIKAREMLAKAREDAKKKKKKKDDDDDEYTEEIPPLLEDEGLGVFPPEEGLTEFGAKYVELPSIMDQDEIDRASKKKKPDGGLDLAYGPDMTALDGGAKVSG